MSRIDFSHIEFLNRIRALIEREQMISRGDSVLIGLSGGADSVALLRVLLAICNLQKCYAGKTVSLVYASRKM